jgi:hypothetical protein
MPIPMQMQGMPQGFPPGYPQQQMAGGQPPARWPGAQAAAPRPQQQQQPARNGDLTVRGVRPEENRSLAMPAPEAFQIAATQPRPAAMPGPEAFKIGTAPQTR